MAEKVLDLQTLATELGNRPLCVSVISLFGAVPEGEGPKPMCVSTISLFGAVPGDGGQQPLCVSTISLFGAPQ